MKPLRHFRRNMARKLGLSSRSESSRRKRFRGRRPTFETLEARQMLAGHPTDLMLSSNSVLENSDNGTVVGTVTADVGGTMQYVLPDDAVGRFAVNTSTGQITVANGALIDFESAQNISITVQVANASSQTYSETFTINVTDVVSEAPVDPFDPINDTGRLAGTPIDWVTLVNDAVAAGGTIINVSNKSELIDAMNPGGAVSAQPGDIVVLATNVNPYAGGSINLTASGTVDDPIIIVPADMLDGTGGFGNRGVRFQSRITITGSNIIFGGFAVNDVANLDSGAIVIRDTENVRITDIEMRNSGNVADTPGLIDIWRSESIMVDHSYFSGNQQLVVIRVLDGTASNSFTSYNSVFEYNTFDNQNIPFQIGTFWGGGLRNSNTQVRYNQLINGSGSISSKLSNVHMFRNYLKDSGALRLRTGSNSSIIGNYIENSKSNGIYLAGGNQVVTNNVIVNTDRPTTSTSTAGITLKYGFATVEESRQNGRRWALNNSLIANNTIISAKINGILARYNDNPAPAFELYSDEFAIPFDNVIVNNAVISDNDPGTIFRGAYRFGISDVTSTENPDNPGYQFGNFTEAKTNNPNDPQNLKRGNNVVANNQAYRTDGVGLVVEGISSAGFLTGDPLFDPTDLFNGYAFRPTAASMLVDAGQLTDPLLQDYYGYPGVMGGTPDIGAIEFVVPTTNVAPTAADDTYSVVVDTVLSVSAMGVLSNDNDLNGDPLTAVLVTGAGNGNVVLDSNGSFTYTPDAGFVGSDSFTYEANDGTVNSNTATVNITVNPVSSTLYRDAILALNPVGYWRLGEASGTVATDETGNFDGTYVDGVTLGQSGAITGDNDTAARFDGTDDYVNIDGYQGVSGTAARSISAWIKTDVTEERFPIVSWGLNETGKKWTFRVDADTGALRVENEGGRIIGTTVLTDGQWYNVVVTLADDGSPNISEAKLYVNGALEMISTSNSNAVDTGVGSGVRIGQNFFGNATGDIDEVAIFGFALTGSQITDLYNQGIATYNADFDTDSDVDGFDFLMWQRGFGTSNANLTDGDADGDQDVDRVDLTVWESTFGQNSGQNAAQNAFAAGAALQGASTTELPDETEIEETEPAVQAGSATVQEETSISTVAPVLTEAATATWIAASVEALRLDVQVRRLDGDLMDMAFTNTNTVVIDSNATARGWFVDSTPWDDEEFGEHGFLEDSDADGVDLLSVLTHGMGQLLGLGHDDARDGIMSETLGKRDHRLTNRASAFDFALAMMLENDDDRLGWK